jgi:hypothetical protein
MRPVSATDDRRRGRQALATIFGVAALLAGAAAGRGEREPQERLARADLSCAEVSDCADRCGSRCPSGLKQLGCLFSCKDRCRDRGAASAQQLFDPLTDCIRESCTFSCIKGPTPKCHHCAEEACALERRVCFAQARSAPGADGGTAEVAGHDGGR